MNQMTIRRVGRILGYFGLTASGIFATIFPSRLIADQVPAFVASSWSVCMIVSGAVCFYGAVTDRWIGEFSGIPMLASVIVLYGISAIAGIENGRSLALLPFGLCLISFGAMLVARWQDVRVIKRNAELLGVSDKGE